MTTPSKPDLVALAERVLARSAVVSDEERKIIHDALLASSSLASKPSLYEAGLRDMRERAVAIANREGQLLLDTGASFRAVISKNFDERLAELHEQAGTVAQSIAAAISALPADGGEKSSEGGCICQGQHRRGYCTEPGCPYSLSDTTRPALSVAVKVKALAWRDHRPDSFPEPAWSAETPFGFYHIEEVSASDSPAYVVRLHAHHFIADKDSLEEAKAAAQADYEKRVRSCISTTSVDDGVVRVLSELRDRRLLNDVDDGLHEEIAESLIKAVRG